MDVFIKDLGNFPVKTSPERKQLKLQIFSCYPHIVFLNDTTSAWISVIPTEWAWTSFI